MYLEISGRCTGKTRRMCEDIIHHITSTPSSIAFIILPPHSMKHEILNNISSDYHGRIIFCESFKEAMIKVNSINSISIQRFITNSKNIFCNPRFYFDEFDMMKPDDIMVVKNGYYVTTPIRIRNMEDWLNWRNDILLRLIVENNFIHVTVHGMKGIIDEKMKLDAIYRNCSSDDFNLEFLSAYDSPDFENDYFNRNEYDAKLFKKVFSNIKRKT